MKKDFIKLLFIFLIIFGLRLNYSTEISIDVDEEAYFYIAQDISSGGSLYQTGWDHKGPVLFFLLVPVIKIFGNNIFALRIYTTVYLLVSMFFIYLIAKRLFGKEASLISALIYGIFFSVQKFGGLSVSTEIFMMFLAIIASYFFIRYIQDKRYSYLMLFLCGLFSGTAILIKPPVFFTIVIFPLILAFKKIKLKQYNWNSFLKEISIYLCGGIVIWLFILTYFIYHKSVIDFYNVYFLYNYHFIKRIPIQLPVQLMLFSFKKYSIIIFLALLFLFYQRKYSEKLKNTIDFLIILSFLSLLGVCSARQMFYHHHLQWGLPFSLLAGLFISCLKVNKIILKRIIYIVMIFLMIYVYWPNRILDFITKYRNRKDTDCYRVAEYISAHTTKQDTIFMFSADVILYFLSERKAAIKYFSYYHHSGIIADILQNKDYILSELSKNKPKYIVFIKDYVTYPKLEYLEKFMLDNYYPEKRIGNYILYRVAQR